MTCPRLKATLAALEKVDGAGVDDLLGCPDGPGGLLPVALSPQVAVPVQLRNSGFHAASIQVTSGVFTVKIDNITLIPAYTVTALNDVTPYYFGFGAATGGSEDKHEIRNVTITFPSPQCL